MDSVTKTKIILFSSLGILLLIIVGEEGRADGKKKSNTSSKSLLHPKK